MSEERSADGAEAPEEDGPPAEGGQEAASTGEGDPHGAEEGGTDAPADGGQETTDRAATEEVIGEAREREPTDLVAETSIPGETTEGGLREEVRELIGRYPQVRSASIPALHALQRRDGWCSPEGMREVAEVMGVEPAYLESIASFYDLFHTEPSGDHRVLVCTNISCWMRGADELLERFCEAAGVDVGEAGHGGAVSDGGELFVSGFECLGACDIAPMASVDQRYYGPLDDDDAATIIAQLRSGEQVLPDRALATRRTAGDPG